MSNYNFTPTLNGLNNIEADEITASSGSIDKLNIGTLTGDTLTNCNLINCTVSSNSTVNLGIAPKQYVDLFAKKSASNIFTGAENRFDNNIRVLGDVNVQGDTIFLGNNTFSGTLTNISGITMCSSLSVSGSASFSGTTTSSNAPTTANDLTNKNYVDNYVDTSIAGCAKLSTANTFIGINTFSNTVNSVITFNGLSTDFNKIII